MDILKIKRLMNIFFVLVILLVIFTTILITSLLSDNKILKEQNKLLVKEASMYEQSYRECIWNLDQWNEWSTRHQEIMDFIESQDLSK